MDHCSWIYFSKRIKRLRCKDLFYEIRKERDSNPRYPLGVCVLSRDVLSATQPSLRKNKELNHNFFNLFLATTAFFL